MSRTEHDSMGEIQVPDTALWGAQTQRSHENFPIGTETMPSEIIEALALIKKAAAHANASLGRLDTVSCECITKACDEVLSGALEGQFPLVVWQTGSGTQSNMNMNEVLSRRARQIADSWGEAAQNTVSHGFHPNDIINMSQSSNDVFPAALHVAALRALCSGLLPALDGLIAELAACEVRHQGIVKCARTHLQDAVPIAFSQEISGWRGLLEDAREEICATLPALSKLALGATAVGTGLNAPAGFGDACAAELNRLCARELSYAGAEFVGGSSAVPGAETSGSPVAEFIAAPNKFAALSGRDACVFAHGALKALAADLMKIANDVRWLASGPRCGLGEITIPALEPGSSIMPGKVNPTQCEALTMVCVQVMGNDAAVGIAASQGNFELNVYLPVISYNFLQSARLLGDAMSSFAKRCVAGITANRDRMQENLERSLMLATALSPRIGYEHAAQVAIKAQTEGLSLKEACVALGYLSAAEFEEIVRPEKMV